MKIYINRVPRTGPWGGGNKTVSELSNILKNYGHDVVYKLCDNLDIIFCFDPRPNDFGEWYQHFINYRHHFNNCKIIQRVGDLGTHSKPELTSLVSDTIKLSDFLIFPSEWAKEYIGYEGDNYSVIHNAPLFDFYRHRDSKNQIKDGKVKIITHHWSTNPKKGFEYYSALDKYCQENDNIEFKYIGRVPEGVTYKNHIIATGDNDLIGSELSNSHIYLTASREEAGANHVLEALASGLPVIYHEEGGSIVNYCERYGLSYGNEKEMFECIDKICKDYKRYKNIALRYNNTISNTMSKYLEVFNAM